MNTHLYSNGPSGDNTIMINPNQSRRQKLLHMATIAGAASAILLLSMSASTLAATTNQTTFTSPEQAGDALAVAWRNDDKDALLKIFGPAGIRLVSSGDLVAEKEAREKLASEYAVQHKIETVDARKALLVIGNDEFPYPIPLVKQGQAWRFDTRAGAEEILDRRIGRNELNAVEVCRAYVEAQREYASKDPQKSGLHEYATKFASASDKHDGLYWPARADDEESPLGPLIANAAGEGYGTANAQMWAPYHGYYYRILTQQGANLSGSETSYVVNGHMTGGFALIAFPAKYGDSGVMTFVVNQNGIVLEKDLGTQTAKIARHIEDYSPDRTWKTPLTVTGQK
jgi:hypothetical protein